MKTNKEGFTLLELLVAMAIIGILIALAIFGIIALSVAVMVCCCPVWLAA